MTGPKHTMRRYLPTTDDLHFSEKQILSYRIVWRGPPRANDQTFFVGWAIARCLSTTPHTTNRARRQFTFHSNQTFL